MTAFTQHDHRSCVRQTLDQVVRLCAERGLRLTPIRRRVLELLLENHVPRGAYDLLGQLHREQYRAQPPVAYRALGFLVENGFAHRLETRNAFVACTLPQIPHIPSFMICRGCNKVAETAGEPASGALGRAACHLGFDIEGAVIEAEGICAHCKDHNV